MPPRIRKQTVTFTDSLVHEEVNGELELGPARATGQAEVTVGKVEVVVVADPDELTVGVEATATSGSASAGGTVETPVGDAGGSLTATGPSATAKAQGGLDGVEIGTGLSAGSVEAGTGVKLLGEDYNVGVGLNAGLKAELDWDSTTEVSLGPFTLRAPNPSAVATKFIANAAKDMVTDPIGTTEQVIEDGSQVINDVFDAADDAVGFVVDLFGGDDDDDDNAVTSSDHGGPSGPRTPGSHPFD